jgi:hypothetical protein
MYIIQGLVLVYIDARILVAAVDESPRLEEQ